MVRQTDGKQSEQTNMECRFSFEFLWVPPRIPDINGLDRLMDGQANKFNTKRSFKSSVFSLNYETIKHKVTVNMTYIN